ncbi:hypothetical protein [Natronorubrum bangense]|uniref:Uncharacterized protein n=2 Tax=Natronorubrum bangense TaxID=61858 RepID=L9WCL5_9EURY|nr:hypothetical protein [Natronorubrum bangense]ELY47097.1 hypothetical protein C494_12871 [Natronorubrum bangense JCM 10635]QCC53460.1 hypothetical protein DV706_02550 [Natronorubrum bangense]
MARSRDAPEATPTTVLVTIVVVLLTFVALGLLFAPAMGPDQPSSTDDSESEQPESDSSDGMTAAENTSNGSDAGLNDEDTVDGATEPAAGEQPVSDVNNRSDPFDGDDPAELVEGEPPSGLDDGPFDDDDGPPSDVGPPADAGPPNDVGAPDDAGPPNTAGPP